MAANSPLAFFKPRDVAQWITSACALAVPALGLLVLTGWALHIPVLKSLHPALGSMKPNTALAFMLAGASLWLARDEADLRFRGLAKALAVLCGLVGLVVLVEYALGLNLGIDELIFRDEAQAAGTVNPGRMAPNTALCFLLTASALFFLDAESPGLRRWLGRMPARLSALAGLMSLLGYLYGVPDFEGPAWATRMALNTALGFILLYIGLMFSRPERALARLLLEDSLGGMTARRLLPSAVALVVALGWLRLLGEQAGFFGPAAGTAGFVLALVVLLGAVIFYNAHAVHDIDRAERENREALRQSDKRFREIVENINDGLLIYDLEMNILDANESICRMLGYARGELIGQSAAKIVSPATWAQAGSRRGRLLEGRPLIVESELTRKDGSLLTVETSALVTSREGAGRYQALVRDISQRKRAEEALRQEASLRDSVAYSRSLLEASPDPMVVITAEGKILDVNLAAEEATGVAREGLNGREFSEFFTEPEKARAGVAKVLAEGKVRDYPLEIRHRDGRLTQVLFNAAVLPGEKGGPGGVLAVARDVTAQRLAESERLEAARAMEEAQRLAHTGSWTLDITANKLYWSDEIYRIFEIDRKKFGATYEAFLAAIHPDDRAAVDRAYSQSLINRAPYEIEHRLLLAGGRVKTVVEKCETFFDGLGRPLNSIGTVQDITDQKASQEALYLLARLPEENPNPVLRLGLDRQVQFANRQARKILAEFSSGVGQKAPEALLHGLAGKEDRDGVARFELEIHGRSYQFQGLVIAETGCVNVYGMDISEVKRMAEIWHKSSMELDDLYNNTPCGYHSLGPDGTFLRINDTELKWLGYRREEVIGRKNIAEVTTPRCLEVFKQSFPELVREGATHNLEFELKRKDGTVFPVLINATAVRDEAGNFVMSRSTLLDLTERKWMEEKLMNGQDAGQREKAKSPGRRKKEKA